MRNIFLITFFFQSTFISASQEKRDFVDEHEAKLQKKAKEAYESRRDWTKTFKLFDGSLIKHTPKGIKLASDGGEIEELYLEAWKDTRLKLPLHLKSSYSYEDFLCELITSGVYKPTAKEQETYFCIAGNEFSVFIQNCMVFDGRGPFYWVNLDGQKKCKQFNFIKAVAISHKGGGIRLENEGQDMIMNEEILIIDHQDQKICLHPYLTEYEFINRLIKIGLYSLDETLLCPTRRPVGYLYFGDYERNNDTKILKPCHYLVEERWLVDLSSYCFDPLPYFEWPYNMERRLWQLKSYSFIEQKFINDPLAPFPEMKTMSEEEHKKFLRSIFPRCFSVSVGQERAAMLIEIHNSISRQVYGFVPIVSNSATQNGLYDLPSEKHRNEGQKTRRNNKVVPTLQDIEEGYEEKTIDPTTISKNEALASSYQNQCVIV